MPSLCKRKIRSAKVQLYYNPHLSDFCSRPWLTQPYNHIIYPGVAKIYLVFFWKCPLYLLILLFLASCSIHLQFWMQKKIFLNHSDIYYLPNSCILETSFSYHFYSLIWLNASSFKIMQLDCAVSRTHMQLLQTVRRHYINVVNRFLPGISIAAVPNRPDPKLWRRSIYNPPFCVEIYMKSH